LIFFTSDHHFGHQNIIKYCSRPFATADEMNEVMIERWNSVVAPDDIVYYLGDFSLSASLAETIAPKLNGKKYLIMGNHDLCHPVNKKRAEKGRDAYLNAGFLSLELDGEIEIAGQKVKLHHLPYLNSNDADKYKGKYDHFRPKNEGQWLLCGHIHEKWKQVDRMINVGVDVWDFMPVSVVEIERMIIRIE
jgi:calcineurin-like phosphoesterase family protein